MNGLSAQLMALAGGAVVGADVCPASGLVSVAVRTGSQLLALGVGVGPRAVGLGWLPRRPRGRAPRAHPLSAALHAHVLGRIVREATATADGLVVLSCVGECGARVLLRAGRHGEVVVEAEDSVVRWPSGARRNASPPRGVSGGRSPSDDADLHDAGATLIEQSDAAVDAAERTAVRRALSRRRAAVARRASAIEDDLRRADEAPDLERVARLMTAQATRIPRGAARAELDDWERGGTLSVALDPSRPARLQAEALFTRARRFRRGKPMIEARLASARSELIALEGLLAELGGDAAGGGSVDDLVRRAASLGVRPATSTLGSAEAVRPVRRDEAVAAGERRPFHVYRGSGGRRILVGRGAGDNDALTTRHARPHDLWLHAKGRTGAHVVVPLDKGESCPSELLVDAATLAAHFSDARGDTSCEVSHLPRRYVRKRRGSAPGAVTLDREKVMILRVEPGRLARLLRSREA